MYLLLLEGLGLLSLDEVWSELDMLLKFLQQLDVNILRRDVGLQVLDDLDLLLLESFDKALKVFLVFLQLLLDVLFCLCLSLLQVWPIRVILHFVVVLLLPVFIPLVNLALFLLL